MVEFNAHRSTPGVEDEHDVELVLKAQRGEPSAHRELFARHVRWVNRLAFALVGRDEDLDEVVQESFVQALSSLRRLKEPTAFPAWLRRIVVQTSWSLARRRRLRLALGLQTWTPVDVDSYLSDAAPQDTILELKSVYRVLEALSPGVRITLILRRVQGLTLDEIAEATGASLATVKRRLAKAEQLLGGREA